MSLTHQAVQRVQTEENLRALLGPVAAEPAQEQQRAANRAVKASALPPGFALDKRWRSTPSPTTSHQDSHSLAGGACAAAQQALSMGLHLSTLASAAVAARTETMYMQALLLCFWFARPAILHDWTATTWDQTPAEYFEWSFGQATTQDIASKTLPAVRWALPGLPRPLPLGCRLPPGLEALGARTLSATSAKGTGAAGGSMACLCFCLLFETYAAVGRTGAARLPGPSADQRNSWSRGKTVTTLPSERAGAGWQKKGEYDTSVSLDLARHQFLFPVPQVLKETRGARQLLSPFSYAQAPQQMEDALVQHLVSGCESLLVPSGTVAQAKTALSTAEAWKKFRKAEDGKASPVYDDAKCMGACPKSFSNKDLHSNATWNDSGDSFNACFFSIFSTARPGVRSTFSERCPCTSVRRWTTWCGLKSVGGGLRQAASWACGVERHRCILRNETLKFSRLVGFFCVLVLRSESRQVNTAPQDSFLWKRPLRSLFMQSWSFVHVGFCVGVWQIPETHWCVHSLWHAIVSLPALPLCPLSLLFHWTSTSALEKLWTK